MLRRCSASTLSDVEGSTLLRAMSLSNGRWAFSDSLYEHPNKEKYPRQRVLVVNVEGYAYLVPFVEDEIEVFLKTIIPSRKATKSYLGESE